MPFNEFMFPSARNRLEKCCTILIQNPRTWCSWQQLAPAYSKLFLPFLETLKPVKPVAPAHPGV